MGLYFIGDKQVTGLSKELFVAVYVSPQGSTIYGENQENGIERLEDWLIELESGHSDSHVLVVGDFNARTGNLKDYIEGDGTE